MSGKIMCVEASWAAAILNSGGKGLPTGLIVPESPLRALRRLLTEAKTLWLPRADVEEDESIKQIIPYVVVRGVTPGTVLSYSRKGGNEGRLDRMRSIGIGGHVEESDILASSSPANPAAVAAAGGRRELREELGDCTVGRSVMLTRGFVNDETTAVGRVHLGVVFDVVIDETVEKLTPGQGIDDLKLTPYSDIDAMRLEPWSRFCLALFTG